MYTSEKFGHTYTFFIMTIFDTFLNNSRKSKSLHYENSTNIFTYLQGNFKVTNTFIERYIVWLMKAICCHLKVGELKFL